MPGLDQLLAQRDDRVLDLFAGSAGIAVRAPRPGLERRLTLGQIAGDQRLNPPPRTPYYLWG
jgi:hypothetical protein